jgi:hypothetical protein
MKNNKIVRTLISPSLFSGIVVLCCSLGMFLYKIVSLNSTSGFFYELLFGNNYTNQIYSLAEYTTTLEIIIFENPALNNILFLLFWILIGVIVYILSTVTTSSVFSLSNDINEIKKKPGENQRAKHNIFKFFLSASFWGLWAIYIFALLQFLIPFGFMLIQISSGRINSIEGVFWALMSFVVLAVSLHVQVILIRLATLKLRLWGIPDVVYMDN